MNNLQLQPTLGSLSTCRPQCTQPSTKAVTSLRMACQSNSGAMALSAKCLCTLIRITLSQASSKVLMKVSSDYLPWLVQILNQEWASSSYVMVETQPMWYLRLHPRKASSRPACQITKLAQYQLWKDFYNVSLNLRKPLVLVTLPNMMRLAQKKRSPSFHLNLSLSLTKISRKKRHQLIPHS